VSVFVCVSERVCVCVCSDDLLPRITKDKNFVCVFLLSPSLFSSRGISQLVRNIQNSQTKTRHCVFFPSDQHLKRENTSSVMPTVHKNRDIFILNLSSQGTTAALWARTSSLSRLNDHTHSGTPHSVGLL